MWVALIFVCMSRGQDLEDGFYIPFFFNCRLLYLYFNDAYSQILPTFLIIPPQNDLG